MTQSETTPQQAVTPQQTVGLLAEFDGPAAIKAAAAELRERGFTRWDVHSPLPIHGIERAMGIRPTVLPWLVLGAGLFALVGALVMPWWMNAVDYPLVLSGKPLFSLPANVPVAFELTVLFAALAAFLGALGLIRLPQFRHFVHGGKRFHRVTTDAFFVSVEAADAKFDQSATPELLRQLGATDVEICRQAPGRVALPAPIVWAVAVMATLALLPPLLIALSRQQKSQRPRVHLIGDMDFQPKYKTQARSALFDDHRTMRPPVPGTVAHDRLDDERLTTGKFQGEWIDELPIPVTVQNVQRGQERYDIYCAPCHGLGGAGDGMTAVRAIRRQDPDWVTPVSLHVTDARKQPVGQLFGTITDGVRKMAGYAAQIPVEDRWKIVLYIRALQRSRNATVEDVPEQIRPQLR